MNEFSKSRRSAAARAQRAATKAGHKRGAELFESQAEATARGAGHADAPGKPTMTPAQRVKQAVERRTSAGSDFLRRNKNLIAVGAGSGAAGGGIGYAAGRNSKIPDGSRRGRRVAP